VRIAGRITGNADTGLTRLECGKDGGDVAGSHIGGGPTAGDVGGVSTSNINQAVGNWRKQTFLSLFFACCFIEG